jgi:hypothetical protein
LSSIESIGKFESVEKMPVFIKPLYHPPDDEIIKLKVDFFIVYQV